MPALAAAWRADIWPAPAWMHLAHVHVVDLLGRRRRHARARRGSRGRPRSAALSDASAPESWPIGVRADETMTEPGMAASTGKRVSYRMVASAAMISSERTVERSRRHRPGDRRGRTGRSTSARCPCPPPTGVRWCGRRSRRCSRGWPRRTRTRAGRCTSTRCPLPELAPDEAVVAVMASSINFNTVWTSIFEPMSTFGFLKRLGKESVWGARHDQPFHVVGSDAAGVVLRVGSAVRMWQPGRRGHRALQPRRRPGPDRARRLDARGQPAHLGLRDQLRRPR